MVCFVTTIDNPYDYFTQFEQWYNFDTSKGYNTCSYVARISNASNAMSDADYEDEVERAVDEIIRLNVTGNYKKITRDTKNTTEEVEEETKESEDEQENEEINQ